MTTEGAKGWTLIIKSVKTPLGFFTLIALILDAVFLGEAVTTARLPIWAPLALLGLVTAFVFVIVLVKPEALYLPSDWPVSGKKISIKLLFPIEPIDVDLNVDRCVLEIRDEKGQKKPQVTPNIKWGHGGWTFTLPEDVVDIDSVRLDLIEISGRKWKVKPFTPYETDVEVFLAE